MEVKFNPMGIKKVYGIVDIFYRTYAKFKSICMRKFCNEDKMKELVDIMRKIYTKL